MSDTVQTNHAPQDQLEFFSQSLRPGFYIRPLLAAMAASLVWYYGVFKTQWFHIPGDVAVPLAIFGILLAFAGMWHAVFATKLVEKAWDEYDKIKGAVEDDDRKTVQKLLYKRVPLVARRLLFFLSVAIQVYLTLLPYPIDWLGFLSTWSIMFLLITFWEVVYALDNPVKAGIYNNIVPIDWFLKEDR